MRHGEKGTGPGYGHCSPGSAPQAQPKACPQQLRGSPAPSAISSRVPPTARPPRLRPGEPVPTSTQTCRGYRQVGAAIATHPPWGLHRSHTGFPPPAAPSTDATGAPPLPRDKTRQKKAGGTARRAELLPPCRLRSICMEIPQREPCRGAEAAVPSLCPPAPLSPCSPARRHGCRQCSALPGDGCRGPAPAPARWRVHTNPALRPQHGAGSRPDGFVPPRTPAPLQEKQTCLAATAADGAFPSPGTRVPPADGGGR